MKVNIRQQRFIDEYILTGNATQSFIKAGYSPNGARASSAQLLAKPNVLKEIEKRRKEEKSDFIWSRNKLVELTQEIIELAMKPQIKDGKPTGGIKSPRDALTGIKHLCEIQGFNAPVKTEVELTKVKTFAEMYKE